MLRVAVKSTLLEDYDNEKGIVTDLAIDSAVEKWEYYKIHPIYTVSMEFYFLVFILSSNQWNQAAKLLYIDDMTNSRLLFTVHTIESDRMVRTMYHRLARNCIENSAFIVQSSIFRHIENTSVKIVDNQFRRWQFIVINLVYDRGIIFCAVIVWMPMNDSIQDLTVTQIVHSSANKGITSSTASSKA